MTYDEAQVQIEGFNRQELRAACKAAGIQYSKLDTNAQRGALLAKLAQEADAFTQAEKTEIAQELAENAPVEYTAANVREHNCPGCGIHLSNGVLSKDDLALVNTDGHGFATEGSKSYYELGDNNHEYECMGCGHQFGKEYPPYSAKEGLKIEKNRPEQNGIKRPSAGGKCRAVWDALDALAAETGTTVAGITSKQVKSLAAQHGFNTNNASIEFYQWRKYNGVTGRAAKQ